MSDIETIVVGAGVVGLAIARTLSKRGQEVLILEAEDRIAQHTSSRNSGVIHAGIYYAKDSLKAQLCVRGKEMLYQYSASHQIPHERTGKLIVATEPSQLVEMESLMRRAAENGVSDLHKISGDEAAKLEPNLNCLGALVSPSTGIVDASALCLSLLGEAEAAGAVLALKSPLERAVTEDGGYGVRVNDADRTKLHCRTLINAAGLGAWDVARHLAGFDPTLVPMQNLAKGHWYAAGGKRPFSRLIYPMPNPESLGVHFVLDTGGGFRFGPDVKYYDGQKIDYTLNTYPDPDHSEALISGIKQWWPEAPNTLTPDSCGIRPRITAQGEDLLDFQILGPETHGLPNLVHLFGIESPGLTSCLAIADHVATMLADTNSVSR